MSFHNKTTHVAQNAYWCEETCEAIEPGMKYVRFSGVSDGDFYSVKMLPQIAALYEKYNERSWSKGDEGVPFGELSFSIDDVSDAAEFLSCVTKNERFLHLRALVNGKATA